MADSFFSGLDDTALNALLARTALRDAALVTVGPALYIEDRNEAAARLTGLRPLERIDQLLSEPAARALRECIAQQSARTVYEELDGVEYRLELIPHRDGALLAFLRDSRAAYDGSLRVIHAKSAQFLGSMLADAGCVSDPEIAAHLRLQCLRMQRMLLHSDFLHDPPLAEQLRLTHSDLSELCRKAAADTAAFTKREIALYLPDTCTVPLEARLVSMAVFNLLTNAVRVTPSEGDVSLTLRDDGDFLTVTIADRGSGLDAGLFGTLLISWQRTVNLDDYLALVRQGAPLGLGLPLAQRIAQLHGGALLLSPREGGGSELHFTIARLPDSLADNNLYAPMILEEGYSLAEIELSCLDPAP